MGRTRRVGVACASALRDGWASIVHTWTNGVRPKGRAFRRWLLKYHQIINLVLVLLVGVATVVFAKQANELVKGTNNVAEQQTALMSRQTEIQASQSLPLFRLSRALERDGDGNVVTEKLILTNEGGLARNAEISILARVQFTWEPNGPSRYAAHGYGVPVPGFFEYEGSTRAFTGQEVYGVMNNMRDYRTAADLVKQRLEQEYGTGDVRYYLDSILFVEYIDYMGNDRREYYLVFIPNRDEDKVELIPISRAQIEQSYDRFSDEIEDGFVLQSVWGNTMEPEDIDKLARMLYEDYQG